MSIEQISVVNPTQLSPARTRLASPAGLSRTALDCFRESRPIVQVIFLLRFLTAAALAAPALSAGTATRIGFGALSWSLATMVIYLYNGTADVVEDRTVGKDRPIATGALAPRQALNWCRALAAASLLASLPTGPRGATLVTLFLLLGYAYSAPSIGLKRHYAGAATVTLAGGVLTFLAGYADTGRDFRHDGAALLLTVTMAAWMGLVGSVTKDFADVRGDRAAGRRTLVLVIGRARAGLVVAAAALGVAGAFATAAWADVPCLRYPSLVMIAGALGVAISAVNLKTFRTQSARAPYRAFMLTQYITTISVIALFASTQSV